MKLESNRQVNVQACEAFISGLVDSDVANMPFAPDVVLASPLDPAHPAVGKDAVVQFLKSRVFPKIPVHRARVERHIVEGEYVATLWTATFKSTEGHNVDVPIFDFFRVSGGLIKEIRPYFDPNQLNEILSRS